MNEDENDNLVNAMYSKTKIRSTLYLTKKQNFQTKEYSRRIPN